MNHRYERTVTGGRDIGGGMSGRCRKQSPGQRGSDDRSHLLVLIPGSDRRNQVIQFIRQRVFVIAVVVLDMSVEVTIVPRLVMAMSVVVLGSRLVGQNPERSEMRRAQGHGEE